MKYFTGCKLAENNTKMGFSTMEIFSLGVLETEEGEIEKQFIIRDYGGLFAIRGSLYQIEATREVYYIEEKLYTVAKLQDSPSVTEHLHYWIICIDTTTSIITYLKKTEAWVGGELSNFGMLLAEETHLFLHNMRNVDGTSFWGSVVALDLETGAQHWVASNLGMDYIFGPMAYAREASGRRSIAACMTYANAGDD